MDGHSISPASATTRSPLASRPNSSRRILVVEDDADIRRLNTEVLVRHGYQVDAAENGARAWNALQQDFYDLVVTDNTMPKVTGVELLKKMRAARMELPVIMATGVLPQAEFALHPWLQPAAVVLKPYTIDELLAAVMEVLRAADLPREQPAPATNWVNPRPEPQ